MALITKMLGIAISDCDAGRITKKQLLEIFQESIDNGDILEEDNEFYVVSAVLPLLDAEALKPSRHIETFEARMNAKMKKNLDKVRTEKSHNQSKKWWQFWK